MGGPSAPELNRYPMQLIGTSLIFYPYQHFSFGSAIVCTACTASVLMQRVLARVSSFSTDAAGQDHMEFDDDSLMNNRSWLLPKP